MRRVRSVVVIALLWLAALAGSSDPDGFGGHGRAAEPGISRTGSSVAVRSDPSEGDRSGKRWAQLDGRGGKRWG